VLLPLTLSRANNLYSVNLFLVFVSLLFSSFLSISLNEFVYNRLELNPEEILFLQFTWLDSFKIKNPDEFILFSTRLWNLFNFFFFFSYVRSLYPFVCVVYDELAGAPFVILSMMDIFLLSLSLSIPPPNCLSLQLLKWKNNCTIGIQWRCNNKWKGYFIRHRFFILEANVTRFKYSCGCC
jgi:hypothetical protein